MPSLGETCHRVTVAMGHEHDGVLQSTSAVPASSDKSKQSIEQLDGKGLKQAVSNRP